MDVMTYTQARKNFALAMDRVCADHAPLVITRQNNDPVVMISLVDYSAIEETLYLMRSPKNYARLLKSIANVKKRKVKSKALLDDEEIPI